MKTYSVTFQDKHGNWSTNWDKHFNLDDIDWPKVDTFAKENDYQAYGYQYGTDSRNLTSARTRTVLWNKE